MRVLIMIDSENLMEGGVNKQRGRGNSTENNKREACLLETLE